MADAHGYYDGAAQKLACVDSRRSVATGPLVSWWSRRLKTSAGSCPWDLTNSPRSDDLCGGRSSQAPSGDRHREDDADRRSWVRERCVGSASVHRNV
jgi:hypothetical protein